MAEAHKHADPLFVGDGVQHGQPLVVLNSLMGLLRQDRAPGSIANAVEEVVRLGDNAVERLNGEQRYLLGVRHGSGGQANAAVESVIYAVGGVAEEHSELEVPRLSAVKIAYWARRTRDDKADGDRDSRIAILFGRAFQVGDDINPEGESRMIPVANNTLVTAAPEHFNFPAAGTEYGYVNNYLAIGRTDVEPATQRFLAEVIARELSIFGRYIA